jgi:hypothetical protein
MSSWLHAVLAAKAIALATTAAVGSTLQQELVTEKHTSHAGMFDPDSLPVCLLPVQRQALVVAAMRPSGTSS